MLHTVGIIYQMTRRHFAEESHFYSHHRENPRYHHRHNIQCLDQVGTLLLHTQEVSLPLHEILKEELLWGFLSPFFQILTRYLKNFPILHFCLFHKSKFEMITPAHNLMAKYDISGNCRGLALSLQNILLPRRVSF